MPDSKANLSPAELARYSRHILLEELGLEGQRKLAGARVLIIGAGGLGSPAALYLAAAGVGTIGIADFDRVEVHNLHRQLLHDDAAVGESKVSSAARRLRTTNPHVRVVEHAEGVTPANALRLFGEYDVIVDGTDNFSARYLNNDAAFFARRPLVYGSVFKFDGQVAVFDPARGGPCYRCLFPEPPAAGAVPGCGEALEAIKIITGAGEPLRGKLLTHHALRSEFQSLKLPRNPRCPLCSAHATIRALIPETYAGAECSPAKISTMDPTDYPLEIPVAEARQLRDAAPDRTMLIDVREPYELEICRIAGAEHVPMREIPGRLASMPKDKHLLVFCHMGGRSRHVTEYLRANGFNAVSNVTGGIDAWAEEIEPGMARY
jgi:molybdopterin/thiamine biosynthesis adenylyltransferase/rhodanese-related sulfurtransferase